MNNKRRFYNYNLLLPVLLLIVYNLDAYRKIVKCVIHDVQHSKMVTVDIFRAKNVEQHEFPTAPGRLSHRESSGSKRL